MTNLRTAAQQALEALIESARLLGSTQAGKRFGCYSQEDASLEHAWHESIARHKASIIAALEQPEQADPVALEKLLHQVIYGDFNADNTDDLKLALAARKEFAALQPRRLTDDQIGQIWFAARIPGLTESDARRLIRAAEEAR